MCIIWHKPVHLSSFWMACISFIRVRRGEDGEKEEKAKEDKGKQKLRQLHMHRYGEPEVPESAFWKKIIAYQQKLLVRCFRVNIIIDILWDHNNSGPVNIQGPFLGWQSGDQVSPTSVFYLLTWVYSSFIINAFGPLLPVIKPEPPHTHITWSHLI